MEFPEEYGDKLRDVFDLCDKDKKGYISVQHFVSLAKEHFGAEGQGEEDIGAVIKVLDPTGDGCIHFGEFCQGVQQIMELCSPSSPPVNEQLPSLYNIGSEETLVPHGEEDTHSCGTHDNSEVSTFNEYDMTDDDQSVSAGVTGGLTQMSPVGGSTPVTRVHVSSEDDDSAISSKSAEHDTKREFEDFGDVDDVDSETDVNRNHNRSLGLNTSKSHRRVSSYTSSAFASQLLRNSSFRSTSTGASRRSSCSDDIYDEIDGNFSELHDKVKLLEAQVSVLTDKQSQDEDKRVKIKEENAQLVERVHLLEEQLRDVEVRAEERLLEEQKQHRDLLSRTDKEKSQQIDLLSQSLQHIEKEYVSLKDEAPVLRSENERLKRDNAHLEERLVATQQQLSSMSDSQEEAHSRFEEEKGQMETECKVNAQLIDELTRELEELRNFKVNQESGGRGHGTGHDLTRSQRKEYEAHILKLREDYTKLKEQNEELQGQVLSSHYQEGRRLLQAGASFAQELENLPKDELMKTVKEQQEENMKMRQYIDKITLRILEKNPSILEIG